MFITRHVRFHTKRLQYLRFLSKILEKENMDVFTRYLVIDDEKRYIPVGKPAGWKLKYNCQYLPSIVEVELRFLLIAGKFDRNRNGRN